MLNTKFLKITLLSLLTIFTGVSHSQTWGDYGDTLFAGDTFDSYGTAVSLTANASFIATGTPFGGSISNSGYVKVHQMVGNVWVQIGQTIEGAGVDSRCGRSAKLVGDNPNNLKLAIGYASYSANNQGEARVFEYNSTTQLWEQIGQTLSGENSGDNFGVAIGLSDDGSTLAVGAEYHDGVSAADCGHVRVFQLNTNTWTLDTDIEGLDAGGRSGNAIDLNGDGTVLAVGAPFSSLGTGQGGNIRVFTKSGGAWNQTGATILGEFFGGELGRSVAISADGLRLGAGCPFGNDLTATPSGYAVVFELDLTSNWSESSPRFYGDFAYYVAGIAVDLSSDGKTIVVGSSEDTNLGWLAGSVSVYKEGATNWAIIDAQIEADAYAGLYGRYVSISGDGNVIAIASPAEFENDPLAAGNGLVHTLILSSSLSLTDNAPLTSNFKAYPNPFENVLLIESEGNFTFSVVDLLGKTISTPLKSANSALDLNLGHLPSGPYIGIMTDENDNVTRIPLIKK